MSKATKARAAAMKVQHFQSGLRTTLPWPNVKAKHGFWRVPWSRVEWTNLSFEFAQCPYANDCLGWTESSPNTTEACLLGTKGPMCAICEVGYTRDTTVCNACDQNSFVLRVVVVFIFVFIGVAALVECRKRQAKNVAFRKYGANICMFPQNQRPVPSLDDRIRMKWSDLVKFGPRAPFDTLLILGYVAFRDGSFHDVFEAV